MGASLMAQVEQNRQILHSSFLSLIILLALLLVGSDITRESVNRNLGLDVPNRAALELGTGVPVRLHWRVSRDPGLHEAVQDSLAGGTLYSYSAGWIGYGGREA